MTNKIINKSIKSVKWSFFTELISRLSGPLVTLILVRILLPADFGIFAGAIAIVLLIQSLEDFGLNKTLIQINSKELRQSIDTAFWLTEVFSLLLYLIAFIAAPIIANFYKTPEIANILRILALGTLIPCNFFSMLEQRNFRFKKLFIIQLLYVITPGLFSIPLALLNSGAWALTAGNLAGSIAVFIYLLTITAFHPKFKFSFFQAKKLIKKSAWIFAENVFLWFFPYGEFLIVGHYLGAQSLGIYQTSYALLGLIFGIFIGHSLPVSYTLFSKLRSNKELVKKTLMRITQITMTISLPLGLMIFLLAKPLSSVLFGHQWINIDTIIAIMGIRFVLIQFFIFAPEVFRAIGRPDINVKLILLEFVYFIPAYLLAAPHGLKIFTLTTTLILIPDLIIIAFIVKKIIKIPILLYLKTTLTGLSSTFIMVAVIFLAIHVNISSNPSFIEKAIKLILIIILGITSYIFSLFLFQKSLLKQMFTYLKEAFVSS